MLISDIVKHCETAQELRLNALNPKRALTSCISAQTNKIHFQDDRIFLSPPRLKIAAVLAPQLKGEITANEWSDHRRILGGREMASRADGSGCCKNKNDLGARRHFAFSLEFRRQNFGGERDALRTGSFLPLRFLRDYK